MATQKKVDPRTKKISELQEALAKANYHPIYGTKDAALKDQARRIEEAMTQCINAEKRLDAELDQQKDNAEKTVIRKKVLVEKLKTGFVTKEFTGEVRSIKGNTQGGVDLMTDVAGDYLSSEAEVIEQVIQSTYNLLTRDGSGAKIVVDVTVIRIV